MLLNFPDRLGALRECAPQATFTPDASGWEADAVGDGLVTATQAGLLGNAQWLTFDALLESEDILVLELRCENTARRRKALFVFSLLPHAQARLRMPLDALRQNRWAYDREGALLKPMSWGDYLDPAEVDRVSLLVHRKAPGVVRWSMTPVHAEHAEPVRLTAPVLPRGVLLDRWGQSATRVWSGKTVDEDDLNARLRAQEMLASSARWPAAYTDWGGDRSRPLRAPTGFFGVARDEQRWWLVAPDGHAFWSAGLDCVRAGIETRCDGLEAALAWMPSADGPLAETVTRPPDSRRLNVDYLRANLMRAYGSTWRADWARAVAGLLKAWGFNTIGNWSDTEMAAAARFPYVRPLAFKPTATPLVFRDFPDVFDPAFASDARQYAEALRPTRDDPALIGYFLMNEPTWGFASQCPAEGMLLSVEGGAARQALADWLRARYGGGDAALADAWGAGASFARVARGRWAAPPGPGARADLEAFSTLMVARLYDGLRAACRDIDPHHLNLGARYYIVPPVWALDGMGSFDVLSVNCYRERPHTEAMAEACRRLDRPLLIGEWHFGALDAGLPASGIGHVRDQAARGRAYRVYLEHAAAAPWCVGAHYFTLYDESALGRFDGENYNIGFMDTCHRPYAPLTGAARLSHEILYAVAGGATPPSNDAPEYLPMLF